MSTYGEYKTKVVVEISTPDGEKRSFDLREDLDIASVDNKLRWLQLPRAERAVIRRYLAKVRNRVGDLREVRSNPELIAKQMKRDKRMKYGQ